MTHPIETHEPIAHGPDAAVPHRGVDLPAAVAISWSLAGGMLLGGAAVVALILTNQMSGHLLLMASATLFALGAVLGMVHGVILGIAGRPEGTTPRQAWSAMVHGLLYLVPALLLGWLIAGWVAAMPIALNGGHVVAAVISAFAWIGMALTVYFAGSTHIQRRTASTFHPVSSIPTTISCRTAFTNAW